MPTFCYRAMNSQGKCCRGKLIADDIVLARKQLRHRGYTVTHIKAQPSWLQAFRYKRQRILTLKQRLLFTQQLAMLLNAGMPLAQSLQSLAQQHPKQRALYQSLHRELSNGNSLAAAMKQHPKAFDPAYCAAIGAGETLGLTAILNGLTPHLQRQLERRHKIQQALWYPMVMVVFAGMILVFLLSTILPNLAQALQDSGQTLAWSTRSLLSLGTHIRHHGLLDLIGLLTVAGIITHSFKKRPAWRHKVQAKLLSLPFFGKACSQGAISTFLATLGMLLSHGIHLHSALSIAKTQVTWQPIRKDIDQAITDVQAGTALHQALSNSPYIPDMTLHIMQCASIDGYLGTAIEQSAADLAKQHQRQLSTLLGLLEPLLVLLMGGLVLWIVLATLLPIFDINNML